MNTLFLLFTLCGNPTTLVVVDKDGTTTVAFSDVPRDTRYDLYQLLIHNGNIKVIEIWTKGQCA